MTDPSAYRLGTEAQDQGDDLEDCPYHPDSASARLWVLGYVEAETEACHHA